MATKANFGQCKCCLKETYLKNMWYTKKTKGEVYGQMLVDCFGIDWMIRGNVEDDKICNACISKLEIAVNFKNQVLQNQAAISDSNDDVLGRNFSEHLPRASRKADRFERREHFEQQIIEEQVEDVAEKEEEEIEYQNEEETDEKYIIEENVQESAEDNEEEENREEENGEEYLKWKKEKQFDDVEFLEEEVLDAGATEDSQDSDYEPEPEAEAEPAPKKPKWPKKPPQAERVRQRMQYTEEELNTALEAVKSNEMTIVDASKTFGIPQKTISNKLYKNTERTDSYNGREILKAMRALMTYTNATPFRLKYRHECTYACYFCSCATPGFDDPGELRDHTHTEHTDKHEEIEFAMRPYNLNQMVRLDITNLTCSCDEDVQWNDMLFHLKMIHNVTDIEVAWQKIVPYNLLKSPERDNTCVLCDFTAGFRQLDTHMNTHYPNFICGECGKPFVTQQRLKTHESCHEGGQYPCDHCSQVFKTPQSKRQHVNKMHDKKLLLKCSVCPERFHKDWQKLAHLKAEHEDMLESMGTHCKLCNKNFWSNDYRRHIIRDHSLFGCDTCNRKFDTQKRLNAHSCQSPVIKYQCDLCFKICATVKGIVGHKLKCQEKHKKKKSKE